MKKIIPFLFLISCCSIIIYAGYEDGLIGPGEYEYEVEWGSGLLVVDGGGADLIMILSPARLEVRSTSPLVPGYGGILDIVLYGNSHMDYFGGQTDELTVRGNASANLFGGRIDYISSFRNVQWVYGQPVDQKINIYCKPGWAWKYENNVIRGITGRWLDNTEFNIRFTTNGEYFGYDPVWANVRVIPEPAGFLLFGLGGLLLSRRRTYV
ncbi:MAG: hypothetical protein WHS88_10050 [Anaerohalosphaeraceae bacterium]